jgi:hypothetical protein
MPDAPIPVPPVPASRPPTGLLANLVAYLASHGIGYAVTPNGEEVVVGFEGDTVRYFAFGATPGRLHLFLTLTEAIGAGETEAEVERLLASLGTRYPLAPTYVGMARYEINARRELGLYFELPMPRSFGPELVDDALWLAYRILELVDRDTA